MLKEQLEQEGISPSLVQQFLADHLDIATQLNDDLMIEFCPVTYQRNKVMFSQIKLLIMLLHDN